MVDQKIMKEDCDVKNAVIVNRHHSVAVGLWLDCRTQQAV